MEQHDRRKPDESQLAWFARTCLPGESEALWFARMHAVPPEERRQPNEHEDEWFERTRSPGESVNHWFARVRPDVPSNMRSPAQKNSKATAMTPRQKKWVVVAVAVTVMWVVGKVALDAKRSSSPLSRNVIVTSDMYYEYCVASGYRENTELKDCEDTADVLGIDPSSHP